jgi:hypothetical protein
MQRKNLFFGTGAALVAVGAIGAGVMVSSNAMAASGAVGDHALTISMVSVGSQGDAFQCTFDATAVPSGLTTLTPVAPGSEPSLHVTGADGAGLPGGATVVSGSAVAVSGAVSSSVSLPAGLTPSPGNGIMITGTMNADGSSSVSQIGADGTVTPVKVRQGTAAECAAAQQGVPPATAGGANTPTPPAAVDPQG